ncbi:hypothetical protein Bca52824_012120 [Brassica carinata]|uniref:Probable purine permease n=1 Tax=Brassica carinata TaxID=52824 RepID=A0A8X8B1Y3_BRACI|nr:hypothetical protein Bca52824_012120 [Brassica carinata]
MKNGLIIINCVILTIGTCGGPLLTRLYYTNGGKRIWFMSFLSTAGFPVILIPLFSPSLALILMETPLFIASIVIGLVTGLDNYLYAYGLAYLPVSTSSLIIGTQLAFNALFAFFMVKQKFTPFSINAVVLLTVGIVVLALHSNGDKPANETHKEYVVGFLMTVIAAVLYAFILPLVEFTYKKARQEITFPLVLEIQMVMCIAATCFCVVGMIIDGDFKVISREAREFKIGGSAFYYVDCDHRDSVARILLRSHRGCVLCVVSSFWRSHQCSASGDGGRESLFRPDRLSPNCLPSGGILKSLPAGLLRDQRAQSWGACLDLRFSSYREESVKAWRCWRYLHHPRGAVSVTSDWLPSCMSLSRGSSEVMVPIPAVMLMVMAAEMDISMASSSEYNRLPREVLKVLASYSHLRWRILVEWIVVNKLGSLRLLTKSTTVDLRDSRLGRVTSKAVEPPEKKPLEGASSRVLLQPIRERQRLRFGPKKKKKKTKRTKVGGDRVGCWGSQRYIWKPVEEKGKCAQKEVRGEPASLNTKRTAETPGDFEVTRERKVEAAMIEKANSCFGGVCDHLAGPLEIYAV